MANFMTVKSVKSLVSKMQTPLKLFVSLIFGMLLILMMHLVQAETLTDPTQPPSALSNGVINGNKQVTSGPVLQSVMIGAHFRAAIINGQKVMLHGKYENATLIKVCEREVVLQNPDKTIQTLDMDYVGIKKIKAANKN